jgi:predicted secreted protein
LLQGDAAVHHAVAASLQEEGDQAGALIELGEAQNMDNAAARFLDPLTHVSKPPVRRNGGEMVLETQDALCDYPRMIDVLRKSPTVLNTEASRQRLEMASKAGSLVVAVDAAETIKPRNSLERMLAHQLGALHTLAMSMMANAKDLGRQHMAAMENQALAVEAARNANAAARLITTFQNGMLTLDRVRRGGRQTVTVQHMTVKDGGQAVVAASVRGRGSRRTPRPARRGES